jgi:hypothetical protein
VTLDDDGRFRVGVEEPGTPWPIYAVLFASTSVMVGVLWDISWHRSIGRDTFWTPAHLAIYAGGLAAGLSCGALALRTTFAAPPGARDESVRFWGFRAPLGAWICIWGAFAMLTSAPFDNWWHNAYGLDVKILSPPHALLASGILAIQVGAMLMALAWQNRSAAARGDLNRLFLLAAGLMLVNAATMPVEYLQRWNMHQALFYEVAGGVFPFFLVSAARASRARWPATAMALVYIGLSWVLVIVLPRFPAHPLLGPIYIQIDHLMPVDFPLLLVAPALGIDAAMARSRGHDWRLAAAIAVVFVAAFAAIQWPFADFLMTRWARNPIFAMDRMPYYADPDMQRAWYSLQPADGVVKGLAVAIALAFVSTRAGLWWGNWMTRVQR